MRVRNSTAAILGATALLTAISGCAPIRQTHGYVPAAAYVDDIKTGSDTRADVVAKIGRPGTSGAFSDTEWFYISRTTETVAFYAPETVEQTVLLVAFDDEGVVEEVERYGLEDGQVINLVTRITPTRGKRLTVLEQLLGNLGNVNPASVLGGQSPF